MFLPKRCGSSWRYHTDTDLLFDMRPVAVSPQPQFYRYTPVKHDNIKQPHSQRHVELFLLNLPLILFG